MNPPINLAIDRSVATLSLTRPETRNALSLPAIDALIAALAMIGANEDVAVVILESSDDVFCSGHDLKELTAHRTDPDGGLKFFETTFGRCSELMQRIVELPQPVIAAIEGVATAAGCQLVASCDLAVVGALARFATPGVNIGLFCATPAVALTRNVAPKQAMEMLLSGNLIDADTAARIGLINRVVPRGSALREARELADQLAGKSPAALRVGKKAVRQQLMLPLDQAYVLASRTMVESLLGPEAVEGIDAFLMKRPPQWVTSL